MSVYYNENDDYAADWLEALMEEDLIPRGVVDRRDIADVVASDLAVFAQCHFFAGIGGWPLALRYAGWRDDAPVWSGSCPCQPVSSAARGRNKRLECERHLWPTWRKLIVAVRPGVVFGEQVAQAADWHALVGDDLEADGYAFGSAYLPAVSVGQDHIRRRFYFVGYANGQGQPIRALDEEVARMQRDRCVAASLVQANGVPARMAAMRAFGNAIVSEVASEFVASAHEAISLRTPS